MIKLNKNFNSSYKSIKKDFLNIDSLKDVENYFTSFIDRYLDLDTHFHFGEAFSKSYVLSQLDEKYKNIKDDVGLIPFGVKDVFNTKVLPTAMGSPIWTGFVAGNNARVVDELADKGALIFSKLTTAEFAVHYFQEGKTLNPFNVNHITGTSSAGSAVAVSSGALPIALGTQTAGSIIRPASFCGVYGFKPSFGAIDRTGTLKTTDTLDTIGFLSADIEGIEAFLYNAMQKEPSYYYAHKYFENINCEFNNAKIGIVSNQFKYFKDYEDYVKNDFSAVVKELKNKMSVENVNEIDFINDIHENHSLIYNKSLLYYFQNEYKNKDQISPVMNSMIEIGKKISTGEYLNAVEQQPLDRKRFDDVFRNFEYLITPSTASYAPKVGVGEAHDTCLIWTYLGYPVINVPLFFDEKNNLPYGLQIIGKKYSDFSLLIFAKRLAELFI